MNTFVGFCRRQPRALRGFECDIVIAKPKQKKFVDTLINRHYFTLAKNSVSRIGLAILRSVVFGVKPCSMLIVLSSKLVFLSFQLPNYANAYIHTQQLNFAKHS